MQKEKYIIEVNPDKELVAEIKKQLVENDGYCPCRLERNEDTKCMCKEFREQGEGMCHCGLYIKEVYQDGRSESND